MKTLNTNQVSGNNDETSLPPSEMKHTPTPWTAGKKDDEPCGIYISADGWGSLARVSETEGLDGAPCDREGEANAAFIVRACNAHDALVAALREIEKGEGAFSRDQLTFANNVIERSKEIARAALKAAQPQK